MIGASAQHYESICRGKETLTLVFQSPQGNGELEVPTDHPMVGGFRAAVERGAPPGKGAFLVVRDDDANDLRLFGMFVLSVNNRLLFFPASFGTIEVNGIGGRFDGRMLDHVTLDPPSPKGRHKSHIAVRGLPDKSRGLSITSIPPVGHLVPWFSVLVPSLDVFPALPQKLLVRFPHPHPDPHQFAPLLEGMGHLSSIPLPPFDSSPNFVQFDAWAGRWSGWKESKAKALAWAYKPDVVDAVPERQRIVSNQINLEFTPTAGVRVILSRPAGALRSSRFFRPSSV